MQERQYIASSALDRRNNLQSKRGSARAAAAGSCSVSVSLHRGVNTLRHPYGIDGTICDQREAAHGLRKHVAAASLARRRGVNTWRHPCWIGATIRKQGSSSARAAATRRARCRGAMHCVIQIEWMQQSLQSYKCACRERTGAQGWVVGEIMAASSVGARS